MIALVRSFKFLQIKKTQLLLGFLLFIFKCSTPLNQISIGGKTMGTTYNIKIVSGSPIEVENMKASIDSILVILNQQMSTWDPESEISKFNRWSSVEPFEISDYFFNVVEKASILSQKTQGRFDITVFDLLSLWGFGPNPKSEIPNKKDIDSIMTYTGFQNIYAEENLLFKKNKRTKIDLNAIAKGYGVDVIFNYIKSLGFNNIFVEIGGEVRFSGYNRNLNNWSVGLENPPSNSIGQEKPFFGILKEKYSAVATSANYRNFVDINGTILGHTINPKTGFPVETDVLSVTVIAETCIEADAWATALMTLSYEDGAYLLKGYEDISAIWLLKMGEENRNIVISGDVRILEPIFKIK